MNESMILVVKENDRFGEKLISKGRILVNIISYKPLPVLEVVTPSY